MKAVIENLAARLPGPVTPKWPMGERFVEVMSHGSMSVELYAPRGHDPQSPHEQDELYFTVSGTGVFLLGAERHAFGPGTCFFVPARVEHRFEEFSEDLSTWVVFWGPPGGE